MNTQNKHAAVIYNPFAGRGKASIYAAKAKKHLSKSGWTVSEPIATEYAGHAETKLAQEWGSKVSLIVLIGGDGTLRELVSGLRCSNLKVEIAFIPMGNANVVARELEIPLNAEKALALLSDECPTKEVDICVLKQEQQKDMVFLAMFEIGFGAHIVHLVNQLRNKQLKTLYKYWGDLVYAISGILALRGLGKNIATIKYRHHDADTQISSSHIVISNMRTYAKGWSLTPSANCTDGLLDIAASRQNSLIATMKTFISASQRKRLKPHMSTYIQTSSVSVFGSSSLFAQVDGDPIGFDGKAEVTLEKKAFTIRVKAS